MPRPVPPGQPHCMGNTHSEPGTHMLVPCPSATASGASHTGRNVPCSVHTPGAQLSCWPYLSMGFRLCKFNLEVKHLRRRLLLLLSRRFLLTHEFSVHVLSTERSCNYTQRQAAQRRSVIPHPLQYIHTSPPNAPFLGEGRGGSPGAHCATHTMMDESKEEEYKCFPNARLTTQCIEAKESTQTHYPSPFTASKAQENQAQCWNNPTLFCLIQDLIPKPGAQAAQHSKKLKQPCVQKYFTVLT